jgi:hypothetical protein
MLDEDHATLDARWFDPAGGELALIVDELPVRAQLYLAKQVHGLRLPEGVRAAADDDEWRRTVRPRVELRLERGSLKEALTLLRERRGADGRSLLPDLEIEALERQGRVREAYELAHGERELATRRGDEEATEDLILLEARVTERMRRWQEASALLDNLADLYRDRRSHRPRFDDEIRARELIVLTSLLRVARHAALVGPQVDAVSAETVELAEATPPRALAVRPSLLRDLAAEIGERSPAILRLAVAELRDVVSNEEVAPASDPMEYGPPATAEDQPAESDPFEYGSPATAEDWRGRFEADADDSQQYD